MKIQKLLLIAVVLTLVVILAACGSESTSTPTKASASPAATSTPTQNTSDQVGGGEKVARTYDNPPAMTIDTSKKYVATMVTNKGTIVFELFADEAPKTVNNFVFLVREGYYDGVIFHRIMKNFMLQGGDPTGTGRGGPGYVFQDEPVIRDYVPGTLAMANAGPNTNGSQFFIVQGREAPLPKQYNIFGMVSEGLDVVDSIADTPVTQDERGESSRPLEEVVIESITIEEEG